MAVVAAAAAILVLVAVGALRLRQQDSDTLATIANETVDGTPAPTTTDWESRRPSKCDPPLPRGTVHDPAAKAEAEQLVQETLENSQRTGWIPISQQDMVTGEWWCNLWTMNLDLLGDWWNPRNVDVANGRQLVYDRIDGTLIGYSYGQAGYITLAELQSGFDVANASIERWGCVKNLYRGDCADSSTGPATTPQPL